MASQPGGRGSATRHPTPGPAYLPGRTQPARHGTSPWPSLPAAGWTAPHPPPTLRPVTSGAGEHSGVPGRENIYGLSRARRPLAGPTCPAPPCRGCLRRETASPLSCEPQPAWQERCLCGHGPRPAVTGAVPRRRGRDRAHVPPAPRRWHPRCCHPPCVSQHGEVTGHSPALACPSGCLSPAGDMCSSFPGQTAHAGTALLPRARHRSDAGTQPGPGGLAPSPVPMRWWPCPEAGDRGGGGGEPLSPRAAPCLSFPRHPAQAQPMVAVMAGPWRWKQPRC